VNPWIERRKLVILQVATLKPDKFEPKIVKKTDDYLYVEYQVRVWPGCMMSVSSVEPTLNPASLETLTWVDIRQLASKTKRLPPPLQQVSLG
jgi:hypothetical protein